MTPGASFCLKALIEQRPGFTVTILSVISILWLSYLLRIFERIAYESQGQKVFESYFTSIWCVVITMTTVGYGDVYSISTFGRLISIGNALWGAFIISCLVASMGRIFDLSEQQKKAIQEINERKQKDEKKQKDSDNLLETRRSMSVGDEVAMMKDLEALKKGEQSIVEGVLEEETEE